MPHLAELLNLDLCQKVHKKLKYPLFDKGDYNLNFAGYRSKNVESDQFDDAMAVWYKVNGEWVFKAFPATLDPGRYYLMNPFSIEAKIGGAAIVAEGYYPGLWALTRFKGVSCLVQQTNIKIYRDKNWDDKLDLDPKTLQSGKYGILVHPHFQNATKARFVANSSAGCQVPQDTNDHLWLIEQVRKAIQLWGNSISYALITEKQLGLK